MNRRRGREERWLAEGNKCEFVVTDARRDTSSQRKGKRQERKQRLPPALVCVLVAIALGVMIFDKMIPSPGIDRPFDAVSAAKNIPATSQYHVRRFPQSGSQAFTKQCPWVNSGQENCTIVHHPIPGNEGIAEWIGGAVQAFLLAQQAGCRFRFGYGPSVDLSQVLSIPADFNWTIPRDFSCRAAQRCFEWKTGYSGRHRNHLAAQLGRDSLAPVPQYRFAYTTKPLNASDYDQLALILTGFSLELGMACAAGTLFHLSPAAAQFEPPLFNRILPTLHDPDALVMALYMRTGHTDTMAKSEKNGQGPVKDDARIVIAQMITSCALKLENEILNAEADFSKVVWCLVSDSPATKQWAIDEYHGQRVALPEMPDNETRPLVVREVLTTGSRGAHSRASRRPSTEDFSDAFIDWYLIGESHLVITTPSRLSFGAMGALRTARPLYGIHAECTKANLIPTNF